MRLVSKTSENQSLIISESAVMNNNITIIHEKYHFNFN